MSGSGARRWMAAVGLTLVGLTAWPLTKDPRDDGFPLSTYPMFATHRPRLQVIGHAVARTSDGRERVVPPAHLGTDEVMQAVATVRRAIHAGAADELCARIAGSVAREPDVSAVEVRSDTFDAVAYFRGDRRPRATQVHARCQVRR